MMMFRLQPLYAADGGTGTGTGKPGGDTDTQTSGAKFTQEDLERAIDERVARLTKKHERELAKAKESTLSTLLDELGMDSVDDLRDKFEAGDEKRSEAEKELRKAQRELKKLQAERDDAIKARAQIVEQNNRATIRSTVLEAAAKAGAFESAVLNDVLANNRLGVDEDGSVFVRDAQGEPAGIDVGKLVKQLTTENPHYLRPTGAEGSGSGPSTSNSAAKPPNTASDEGLRAVLGNMSPDDLRALGGR